MVWRQTLLLCTACIWFLIQQVACSGVFELRLKSFVNEQGKDSLGQCCNGERIDGQCIGQCRTRFRVCLKHFQNKIDTTSTCTFGDVTTPVLGDNNMTMNKLPPDISTINFPFDFSWPGWFSLIVEAWHDASSNVTEEDVGISSRPFTGLNISGRRLISRFPMQQWLDVKPQWTEKEDRTGNAKVLYEFRVMCLENYYGAGCANLCRSRDDNFGHYGCSANGEIVCLPGWKGDYCTKPQCSSGCDKLHGYCTKPGECLCHSGWKGTNCDECERYPGCAEGRCEKPWDCICNEGWGGLFCNQDLNFCTNHRPCRNGGTCFNTGQGSYTCSCPPGYTGRSCDTKLSNCSHPPCLNGSTRKVSVNVTAASTASVSDFSRHVSVVRPVELAAVSTASIGDFSRHVSVVRPDDGTDRLLQVNWFLIICGAVAIPAIVIVAVLYVKRLKQRREHEKEKADEEARMQNEQNSVHSSCVTMRGDTHMIKNTWGQCVVKEVDAVDQAADYSYPKQSYVTVPADPNLTPTWDTLQRSRSQKQLNIDPPLHRHSVVNRVDLDKLVRAANVSTPLDNRLSVLSINISQSNLR